MPSPMLLRLLPAAALCAGPFLAAPTLAFKPSAKVAARVSAAGSGQISDADLKAIARKLQRARPQRASAKAAATARSPLASTLRMRPLLGPAAPLGTPGRNPRLSPPVAAAGALPPGLRINWNSANGTPAFLDGPGLRMPDLPARPTIPGTGSGSAAPGARALAYFHANKALFRLDNPVEELRLAGASVDGLGSRHEIFHQVHRGVPVWGGSIHAHFNSAGALYAVNARYAPTPAPAGSYRLTAAEAAALACADVKHHSPLESFSPEVRRILAYAEPAVEKNVWVDASGRRSHWAWRVEIRPNFRDQWRYFIDGATGAILEKYNATNFDGPKTADATDLLGATRVLNTYQVGAAYYLIDATRRTFNAKSALPNDPKGALWTLDAGNTDLTTVKQVSSSNNQWPDAAAVSAHLNLGRVFDYYLDTFGRLGIDGAGSTLISVVHVTEKGRKMDNAYWNGKAMAYGDGDQGFLSLARALDVAAHEMTHGVIGATVNLEYKFQSGALNESLADVFGAMVDRDDWKIGEDVVKTTVFGSGALRDMEDPHNGAVGPSGAGWQPAHMSEFVTATLEDDNGGVHVNSGIPNRACFLIAEAIGRAKTEKIYYRVLEAKYLNSASQFIDMRVAAIRAATDLHGEASPEVAAVKEGFARVGIGTGAEPDTPTPRPQDAPPVVGEEFVAVVNADPGDNSLYLAKPVLQKPDDIGKVTETQVYTGTGNPIAIPDDGSFVLFIDAGNRLCFIDDAGEQVLNAEPIWKSIAIAPNGGIAAITTLVPDAKIYILDLVNPDETKAIPLYTPTTGLDVKADNVVFADALDFNSTGEFLLYDALNRVTQAEGDSIEYWDANLLDVKSGIITPFLPTRPEGIGIGNPSFAQTSDLNLVFDLFSEDANSFTVVTADLFTGAYGVIDSNGAAPGYARYSTRDDFIVYERHLGSSLNVQQAPLAKDKVTRSGPPAAYMTNAQKPLWFAIGKRSAGLPRSRTGKPERYALSGDGRGGLRLELPGTAEVVVAAYDLSGRKRGELLRGRYGAGAHGLDWTEIPVAGVYLVRMEARPAQGPPVTVARKIVR